MLAIASQSRHTMNFYYWHLQRTEEVSRGEKILKRKADFLVTQVKFQFSSSDKKPVRTGRIVRCRMCFCKERNYKSKRAEDNHWTSLCCVQEQFLFPLFSFILPHFPRMWFIKYLSPRCWLSPPLLCPPCPSAISTSVGSEGKGKGWSQDLILRGEMVGRGRMWGDILPLLLPGGTICYKIMLCQLQRPSCISAASAGGGRRAPSSSHKQRAIAPPFLICLLVTFLRLMLPLFHWIQSSLDLCVGLSLFPDKKLATTEARDIKKYKGY